MNRKHFIAEVRERSHVMADERSIEEGTIAVLHTLSHRLTEKESRDVCSQLSQDVKTMWEEETFLSGLVRNLIGHQLTFKKKADLYEHIRNELRKKNIPIEDIEPFTGAVFHVLKEQISEGEIEDVAAQLPGEIKALWLAA